MIYRYFNRNPHLTEEEDCVCRAISTALGIRYNAANNLLSIAAAENDCEKLCVCCYHHLLEDILCLNWRDCGYSQTVGEIAESFPHHKILLRIDGHLTCSIYGTVLDIWDCTDEMVDCFWIV